MIRLKAETMQRATALMMLISALAMTACGNKPASASNDHPPSGETGQAADQPTVQSAAQGPTTESTTPPTAEITAEPTTEPTRAVVELTTDTGAAPAAPTEPPVEIPVYDTTELDIIAAINEYRVQTGLWPLSPNADLRTLAHLQGDYLASLPDIPWENIHAGASGEDPMTRAAQHGWPTYNNAQQIAIAENAYVGASVLSAMTWWKGSELHNRTMLGVGFREVGVAAVESGGMKIMIVVFGSRPGVLPALYDPASGLLYLTSERYRYAPGGSWIQDVSQVSVTQATDTNSVWGQWRLTVVPPANRTAPFRIMYDDGKTTLEMKSDPRIDIAWLPSTVGLNGVAPEVLPVASEPPNVNIVYNSDLLEIVNIGGESLDLFGLDIAGSGYLLSATAWNNAALLRYGLDHFQTGTCLQVHRYDIVTDMTLPAGCTFLELSIYLMPDKIFWANADFEVRYKGVVLNVCKGGEGVCPVAIPTE